MRKELAISYHMKMNACVVYKVLKDLRRGGLKMNDLFWALASFGVREGSEAFLCWKTKADMRATASSGSRSSNWFSNRHSVQINSSPEFISQATRPLIWTTRSESMHPISLSTSI